MKIAAAQIKPIKGNIKQNIENHKKLIDIAITRNVDVIIFPELSITGYEPDLAEELSIHYEDPILNDFQTIADRNNISIGVGMPTRIDDQLMISCIIFQPNRKRDIYSKQHLFPTEVDIFTKGEQFYQLEVLQNIISIAICYDLSDPLHSEHAFRNNSQIYFASVLNSVQGIDNDLYKLSHIGKKYNMHVMMANFIGESGGYTCAGQTSVWNNEGKPLGQLNNTREGILILNTENNQIEKCYNERVSIDD
ncbi:carbon-nitrogen hydrolase family protein [Chryseobacterium sp.]|uniref:carbon-nitrogen hydrolase family protein n=1 Tax=Chryseobacterium sp. TaxID=1871047 RepID=UPI0025BB2352|nr:carbon-nitrogen hydrolase family protein [Chryseobacterium sp.]